MENDEDLLQVQISGQGAVTHVQLHATDFLFTRPRAPPSTSAPPLSNNKSWARARRAPLSVFSWKTDSEPTPAQVWLVLYAVFTIEPETEAFRVALRGHGSAKAAQALRGSMLAIAHPPQEGGQSHASEDELLVLRSAFWQGAGSPFGSHPPWAPASGHIRGIEPVVYDLTTGFPETRVHTRHPRRPAKPTPGSVVYSRYISSLDSMFSLIALDYENEQHLQLFHKWQNDPRVARGWNETGTIDHHRDYLKRQHEDPHTLTVLGRFDDDIFSYFEIFWAKEDHVGAHYDAGDFDRGRHTIVGEDRFRGQHRVLAWWPSIIHYCFLDDSRTAWVVGEPIATNSKVMVYDYTFGLNVEKFIDFPHKRAALVKVTRERFFQLSPLHQGGGFIAGTGVSLPAKI